MKLILTTLYLATSLAFLSSCNENSGNGTSPKQNDKPVIHTVNYPLYYFAKRIGGDLIDLRFSAPASIDPAYWEPTDEDIAAMQNADLIFMNGATYSKWAENVSLPTNTRVDTSKAFKQALISEEGKVTHSHGNGVVHSHDGIASTTWLNMEYAHLQAEAIRDALIKLMPEQSSVLSEQSSRLFADLGAIDQSLKLIGTKLSNTPLLGSHPVYQYLAYRYKLNIKALHWEPEINPDPEAMTELVKVAAEHPAKIMLWEGGPATASIEKLSALGIESIVVSPCGNRPDSGDWLSVMKANVSALESLVN